MIADPQVLQHYKILSCIQSNDEDDTLKSAPIDIAFIKTAIDPGPYERVSNRQEEGSINRPGPSRMREAFPSHPKIPQLARPVLTEVVVVPDVHTDLFFLAVSHGWFRDLW